VEGHTVRTFDGDILTLRMRVLAMGGLAIDQVQRAVQGLVRDDDDAGRGVIARGAQITAYAQSIDEEIIGLIARRQPMASDLRAIMGIGRVASDLERVGNAARKIARLAIELHRAAETVPLHKLYNDVRKMSRLALAMLRDALNAFDRVDLDEAAAITERDAELDGEFQLALRELVTYVMEDPRHLRSTIQTVFLMKALERVGDHARNIALNVSRLARRDEVPSAAATEGRGNGARTESGADLAPPAATADRRSDPAAEPRLG
jgi:phosphate transport system protein